MRNTERRSWLPFAMTILTLTIFGLAYLFTYNGIVSSQKQVEAAWADVTVVCQRRLELIPNLIETVTQYAKYERQTLLAVLEKRNTSLQILQQAQEKMLPDKSLLSSLTKSQESLASCLKEVFALAEAYPDLKASAHFLALQDQLEGTENRIAVARQRYNQSVKRLNTKVSTFPGNLLASKYDFHPIDYYQAPRAVLEPVRVTL